MHRCLRSTIALFLLGFFAAGHSLAEQVVTLVAGERPPYIGSGLPKSGYVVELVEEAFRRKDHRVRINFVPWARARMLSDSGQADGILPADYQDRLLAKDGYVYSDPFPGGAIGLLKKKSLVVSYAKNDVRAQSTLFQSLKGYRFGMVRGGLSLPALDEASSGDKVLVSSDIQNLDMLGADRIQFALIDKFSAADLMVGQRPNLIGQLEFMTPPLAQRDFYLALSTKTKNHRQLLAAFNAGLAEMKRDGTLERIMNRHGLFLQKKVTPHKVQLTIGTVNNSDMIVMQSLSREFEKQYPNIALDWRVLDENTLRLRLLSDLAVSDGQFDVMTIGTYEAPLWARQGWLMPLQGLPERYEVNDLLPTVRAALSYDGELYALPFYAESVMTYYRKDLFAKAGLSMPANPGYQDIVTFAARIHDPAAGVYGLCLRGKPGWGENMAYLGSLVRSFGGRWFDEKWRPQLDSPAWEKAISFYVEALTRYGPPSADRNGFNENLVLFSEGRCGIWIDATVAAGMLFDAKRSTVADRTGFVAAPVSGAEKGSGWLWSWALAIPNSSTHKAEALQFITWATSRGYIQSVANAYGWVAVPPGTRKSTYAKEGYQKAAPFSQFVLDAIESVDIKPSGAKAAPISGVQYVNIPEFTAIGSQVGAEMAKALRQELSVRTALRESQSISEEVMRRSGYFK